MPLGEELAPGLVELADLEHAIAKRALGVPLPDPRRLADVDRRRRTRASWHPKVAGVTGVPCGISPDSRGRRRVAGFRRCFAVAARESGVAVIRLRETGRRWRRGPLGGAKGIV